MHVTFISDKKERKRKSHLHAMKDIQGGEKMKDKEQTISFHMEFR